MRDELAVDTARQNDRASLFVVLRLTDQLQQLNRHRSRHVVHRRIAHRPDLDVFLLLDFEILHAALLCDGPVRDYLPPVLKVKPLRLRTQWTTLTLGAAM